MVRTHRVQSRKDFPMLFHLLGAKQLGSQRRLVTRKGLD
jgi:hypothetical protein